MSIKKDEVPDQKIELNRQLIDEYAQKFPGIKIPPVNPNQPRPGKIYGRIPQQPQGDAGQTGGMPNLPQTPTNQTGGPQQRPLRTPIQPRQNVGGQGQGNINQTTVTQNQQPQPTNQTGPPTQPSSSSRPPQRTPPPTPTAKTGQQDPNANRDLRTPQRGGQPRGNANQTSTTPDQSTGPTDAGQKKPTAGKPAWMQNKQGADQTTANQTTANSTTASTSQTPQNVNQQAQPKQQLTPQERKARAQKSMALGKRLGAVQDWLKAHKDDPSVRPDIKRLIGDLQTAAQLAQSDTPENAEQDVATLENEVTTRTGIIKFRASVSDMDQAQNNPRTTIVEMREVETRKREMGGIADSESQLVDDISRTKWLFFDSKDEGYQKNVSDLVKKTMKEVMPALTNAGPDSSAAIKTLTAAMDKLAVQRAHYADMRGLGSKDTEQRKRKVQAIDGHLAKMEELNGKLRSVLKIFMKPALDVLQTLPAVMNANPEAGKAVAKEFADKLKSDDKLREDLFQSVGVEQCQAICQILDVENKWCKEFAETRAADTAFMTPLCQAAIQAESKDAKKDTLFRANGVASKLCTAYAENSPGGKALCESTFERYAKLTEGLGTLEINPANVEGDGKDKQKKVEQNIKQNKEVLGAMVNELTQAELPPEIAELCKMHYQEGLRVAKGNKNAASAEDEEFATTQSGAFLMLRLINPMLTNKATEASNKFYNDTKNESGLKLDEFEKQTTSDFKKFKAKHAKMEEQSKLARTQTKILQNMANRVEYKIGGKEDYMAPMNSVIKGQNGQDAPETAQLRGFLKKVGQNGAGGGS